MILDPATAYRSVLQKLEPMQGTQETASTERVKKPTSGRIIIINDLDGTRELVWEIENVLAHKINQRYFVPVITSSTAQDRREAAPFCAPAGLEQEGLQAEERAWPKGEYE